MAKMILKLEICANVGYDGMQVVENRSTITVGALREMLADFDDDVEIVTFDHGNRRGAAWGNIIADQWLEEIEADEFDEDEDDEE